MNKLKGGAFFVRPSYSFLNRATSRYVICNLDFRLHVCPLPGHVDGVGSGDERGGDLLHGQAPEDADVGDVMALLPAPVSSLSTRLSGERKSIYMFSPFLKRFLARRGVHYVYPDGLDDKVSCYCQNIAKDDAIQSE